MKKRILFKIKRKIREKVLRPWLRDITGVDEFENNIYYILNSSVDITKCKQTTGPLRQIQLACAELLRIFDEVCTKNNITYWLDWGTLLGAVRHKGFIPWDDDLDVCIPRAEYERAFNIIKDFFEKYENYGIAVGRHGNDSMYISLWNAGVNLDIFLMDKISVKESVDSRMIDNCVIESVMKTKKYLLGYDEIIESFKRQLDNKKLNGDSEKFVNLSDITAKRFCFDVACIYPLKKLKFEDYDFFVPNRYEEYLSGEYGDYMSFPQSGILHHKGLNNNPTRKGTDMEKTIEMLKSIHGNQ